MSKFAAIVLAAGKGTRMNSDVHKQYMNLAGKPVIYYSLRAFSDSPVDEIVLVTGVGEQEHCRRGLIQKYHFTKVTHIVEGGAQRYHSVYQGLKECLHADYVMIHDGARPFVTQDIICRAMEDAPRSRANIVAVPVKDTIKMTDEKNWVTDTPRRDQLWAVQTPQTFETKLLRNAYEAMMKQEDADITDDAMVMERYGGHRVHVIMGDYRNIKITTPEDLLIGEIFASEKNNENSNKKLVDID